MDNFVGLILCSTFALSVVYRSWLHNFEPKNETVDMVHGGPTSCSKDLAKTKINNIRGDNARFHIINRRSVVERMRDTRY